MIHRGALVLSPETEGTLSALPGLKGWTFHHTASFSDGIRLVHSQRLSIGILCCQGLKTVPVAFLEEVLQFPERLEWIVLVRKSQLDSPSFRSFVADNCFDYCTFPVEEALLSTVLGHAYGKSRLRDEKMNIPDNGNPQEMIGECPAMLSVFRRIRKLQSVDFPVLIKGESGTGRALAARVIHGRSARAQGPFVAVNCGALPADLMQSDLSGRERRSISAGMGGLMEAFESAAGGTVFLDYVERLSVGQQARLLRVLSGNMPDQPGTHDGRRSGARVIAATSVDLEKAVRDGSFCEDIYYRLTVLCLMLPPLRERGDDIERLANRFLMDMKRNLGGKQKRFSQQALQAMRLYSWPGNVRELMNCVQSAVIMGSRALITAEDLGLKPHIPKGSVDTLDNARAMAEKEVITICLSQNKNNISRAARQLGISRVTLYRLMGKFAINA